MFESPAEIFSLNEIELVRCSADAVKGLAGVKVSTMLWMGDRNDERTGLLAIHISKLCHVRPTWKTCVNLVPIDRAPSKLAGTGKQQENLRAICGHVGTLVACQLRTERKYLRSLACRLKLGS